MEPPFGLKMMANLLHNAQAVLPGPFGEEGP